jgi:hypothetical protein
MSSIEIPYARPVHRPEGVEDGQGPRHYCAVPVVSEPEYAPGMAPKRVRALRLTAATWVNGTLIHYHFVGGHEKQREVVRRAFGIWKEVGIGLDFMEVDSPDEAEVRIGFLSGDGSWSYIGTYVLEIGTAERTMNFGWDLTHAGGLDTALHEIGHTLGLPHEHQNPFSGIVWNEEAVYAALALPPNRWSRETTFHNIIRKLEERDIAGSQWDPDSIMHYPFDAGLISAPERYRDGVRPAGGLSPADQTWARRFYPPMKVDDVVRLRPGASQPLPSEAAAQEDFLIEPAESRKYDIRTFGSCDTVAVLFEERGSEWRFHAGDDDGGEDRNAALRIRLVRGRRYMLRVRIRYTDGTSPPTVMLW